jgi:hypothetical protein
VQIVAGTITGKRPSIYAFCLVKPELTIYKIIPASFLQIFEP